MCDPSQRIQESANTPTHILPRACILPSKMEHRPNSFISGHALGHLFWSPPATLHITISMSGRGAAGEGEPTKPRRRDITMCVKLCPHNVLRSRLGSPGPYSVSWVPDFNGQPKLITVLRGTLDASKSGKIKNLCPKHANSRQLMQKSLKSYLSMRIRQRENLKSISRGCYFKKLQKSAKLIDCHWLAYSSCIWGRPMLNHVQRMLIEESEEIV